MLLKIKNTNMEKKTDYQSNLFVANLLMSTWSTIKAEVPEYENFGINDIDLSAFTDNFLHYTYYPLECKTIKGNYNFFEKGVWRTYFTSEIYNKLTFEDSAITSGSPVYFINATDKSGDLNNAKYHKILDAHGCLAFLAGDACLLFSPSALKEAFIGYAYYPCSHKTEIGKKGPKTLEKKAVLDLSKAHVIPCVPPSELLMK